MDWGFKKLFSRRTSKSKPAAIAETVPATFPRPPPRHGSLVAPLLHQDPLSIKPSHGKVKQKSFSHLRTKSIALEEVKPSDQTDAIMRPKTAPGKSSPRRASSFRSRLHYRSRASQDGKRVPSNALDAPPNIPELPKGLADMGGSKYYDLTPAAALGQPNRGPDAAQGSADQFNESAANRNSGKPIDLISPPNSLETTPDHEDHHSYSSRQSMDAQRASFDAMRACRDAKVTPRQLGTERDNEARTRSPASAKEDTAQQAGLRGIGEKRSSELNRIDMPDSVILQEMTGGRASRAGTDMQASGVGRQASPASQGMSGSTVSSVDAPSTAAEKKLPANPSKLSAFLAPSGLRRGSHADTPWPVLISGPAKAEESIKHTSAEAKMEPSPLPSPTKGKSSNHPLSNDRTILRKPQSLTSDHGTSGPVSGLSGWRSEREAPLSQDRLVISESISSKEVSGSSSSLPGLSNSLETATQVSPREGRKELMDEDDSDSDAEMVDAVAHQEDLVQMLRASVVSANEYTHRAGQDPIMGTVLQHRPSPGMSDAKDEGMAGGPRKVPCYCQEEEKMGAATSVKASSPQRSANSTSGSAPSSDQAKKEQVGTGTPPSPLRPVVAPAPLTLPRREGGGPKASLRQTEKCRQSHMTDELPSRSLRFEEGGPEPKSAGGEVVPGTVSRSTPRSAPVLPFAQASRENERKMASLPPIVTRDFASALSSAPANRGRRGNRAASGMSTSTGGATPKASAISAPNGYIYIRPQEVGDYEDDSELERRIAVKKQAAAQALLRLQEVMARPTWEEGIGRDPVRTPSRVPGHWRGLSIEDGSPIAPSAIFNQVRIPSSGPPVSRHSTLNKQAARAPRGGSGMRKEADARETASERRKRRPSTTSHGARSPDLTDFAPRPLQVEAKGKGVGAAGPSSSSTSSGGRAWQAHSRKDSMVSAGSGASAHSLPHHMVPTRGSSRRDSDALNANTDGDGFIW